MRRLLIVDDEPLNIKLLVKVLHNTYDMIVATQGATALQFAEKEQPDLILLDIMMPEMDGYEVCRRLKDNPKTEAIPVIFITTKGDEGAEAMGLQLGAVDYVHKPINLDVLRARLTIHLDRADQNRSLARQLREQKRELEKTQNTLRDTIGNLQSVQISTGVFWLQIPEAHLSILCGCPSDIVKILMRKGLITHTVKQGVRFETGPNVVLLSDLSVQNGGFSNMAEFPVLQMLYRQGMLLPGHPNNTGLKPMLIGSTDQLQAQLGYIHRGNYGLLSKEEICSTGVDEETAEYMMRIKMKFSFGQIREPAQFLDTLAIDDQPREIRHGVTVQRMEFNRFRFAFRDQSADIDLNLPPNTTYQSPYPLGHHRVRRHYFAVLHAGSGDGWDSERPCMGSVVMFQGRVYLVDAVPGVMNTLNALGIDISELAGIFQTHAHDDHFAGLPELIRTDRRLPFFSTALVRLAVTKKFAALMSVDEKKFAQFFDVHDLALDVWNKCDGLDVMPLYAPHPVEDNLFVFRALGSYGYRTYAHWADLTAVAVLDKMVGVAPTDIPSAWMEKIKKNYFIPVDIKKLDVGGGMIHGVAKDFVQDTSKRLILAHTAHPSTPEEQAFSSEVSFGSLDVLIKVDQDYRRQTVFCYLRKLLPEVAECEIWKLTSGLIVEYDVGTVLRQGGLNDGFVDMIITGEFVYQDLEAGFERHLGFGSFMGLGFLFQDHVADGGHYRALSHGTVLKIPVFMAKTFMEENGLTNKMAGVWKIVQFLTHTWLFGERTSFVLLSRMAQRLEPVTLADGVLIDWEESAAPLLWIVITGRVQRVGRSGELQEIIGSGGFFGEHSYLKQAHPGTFKTEGACELYKLQWDGLLNAPIIHWKMLEVWQKRIRQSA